MKKEITLFRALMIIVLFVIACILIVGTPIFTIISAFLYKENLPYTTALLMILFNTLELCALLFLLIIPYTKSKKKPKGETNL